MARSSSPRTSTSSGAASDASSSAISRTEIVGSSPSSADAGDPGTPQNST